MARLLRKKDSGRIFGWTPILAQRSDMEEVTEKVQEDHSSKSQIVEDQPEPVSAEDHDYKSMSRQQLVSFASSVEGFQGNPTIMKTDNILHQLDQLHK